MNDDSTTPGSPMSEQEKIEALQGLRDAVAAPVDPNNLGKLAQMHTWCQTLAASDDLGTEGSPLARIAATLADLLENLILAEAARPDEGLALIPQVVAALQDAGEGREVDRDAWLTRMKEAIGGSPEHRVVSGPPETAAAPDEAPLPAGGQPQEQAPKPVAESAALDSPAASSAAGPPGNATPPAQAEPYISEPLVVDLDEQDHLLGFVDEATEHMDTIEAALLDVERNPTDPHKLNELFRPFHTIKGIAGFLNLRDINRLTHEVETILDLGRKGELQITPLIIDLIFAAIDVLKHQIDELRNYLANPVADTVPQPPVADIIARLHAAASPSSSPAAAHRRLGEILAADRDAEIEAALDLQAQQPELPKLGELLVDMGVVSPEQVDRALSQQAAGRPPSVDQSIRVDTSKLDTLVDAVGELVIAQTMVSLHGLIQTDESLGRQVTQVTKIVRDVQQTAMGMRMVPIGQTFQKMRRLVRDVSRKAGKTVELVITGEDTELDKHVIQQISDPLVHMVRNAVDHGVELPAARRAAGKPPTGQVYLHAYHQGDSIAIQIGDDGSGLDRDKLIAKGIERGLIGPDDQLSDQQAFALTLAPGFSTATEVTDISGRGVGMDVVKRNIEQLRGKIEITSEPGRGTTFTIRLPLTLAIIDGMLIRVGAERLIIPTTLVEQSLRPERKHISTVQQRGEMVQVRGELLPLIQLGALFGYQSPIDPSQTLVVITHCEGHKLALAVDELIDQQQVVIKTLGERFKGVKGISGAAILGDGRVGLILEPAGLLALHNSTHVTRGAVGVQAAASVAEPGDGDPDSCDSDQTDSEDIVAADSPELATTSA